MDNILERDFSIPYLLLLAQYTEKGQGILGSSIDLGRVFDGIKRNVQDYSSAIDKIKELNSLDIFKNGKVDTEAFIKAVGTSDAILINYTET